MYQTMNNANYRIEGTTLYMDANDHSDFISSAVSKTKTHNAAFVYKEIDGVKYAVCGALAGVANGFFGAGGGMVLVPLFTRWIKMEDKTAFATSLAVILPLSAVSAIIYLIKGSIDFGTAIPYLIGGLVGGTVGGKVFRRISARFLHIAFALLIIYGAVRSLFVW